MLTAHIKEQHVTRSKAPLRRFHRDANLRWNKILKRHLGLPQHRMGARHRQLKPIAPRGQVLRQIHLAGNRAHAIQFDGDIPKQASIRPPDTHHRRERRRCLHLIVARQSLYKNALTRAINTTLGKDCRFDLARLQIGLPARPVSGGDTCALHVDIGQIARGLGQQQERGLAFGQLNPRQPLLICHAACDDLIVPGIDGHPGPDDGLRTPQAIDPGQHLTGRYPRCEPQIGHHQQTPLAMGVVAPHLQPIDAARLALRQSP